jgi:hypothetical protein
VSEKKFSPADLYEMYDCVADPLFHEFYEAWKEDRDTLSTAERRLEAATPLFEAANEWLRLPGCGIEEWAVAERIEEWLAARDRGEP